MPVCNRNRFMPIDDFHNDRVGIRDRDENRIAWFTWEPPFDEDDYDYSEDVIAERDDALAGFRNNTDHPDHYYWTRED